MGSGRQRFPRVHLDDVVGAIEWAMTTPTPRGACTTWSARAVRQSDSPGRSAVPSAARRSCPPGLRIATAPGRPLMKGCLQDSAVCRDGCGGGYAFHHESPARWMHAWAESRDSPYSSGSRSSNPVSRQMSASPYRARRPREWRLRARGPTTGCPVLHRGCRRGGTSDRRAPRRFQVQTSAWCGPRWSGSTGSRGRAVSTR